MLRQFLNTFNFVRQHPLGSRHKARAFANVLGWQLRSRLFSDPHNVAFVGNTRLLVDRGMHGATGNIYCGLHEFPEMAFMLHFLRPGDLFADIGANIGSYSILAAGIGGAHAIAVEPIPATAAALEANVALNGLDHLVRVERRALGEFSGIAMMVADADCTNHIALNDDANTTVDVPQITLDELLAHESPTLIKIDVEGYEMHVLRGANRSLGDSRLQALIMDVNGSGQRYGVSDGDLNAELKHHGFDTFDYRPHERHLYLRQEPKLSGGKRIFVRDFEQVSERLRVGDPFEVFGEKI